MAGRKNGETHDIILPYHECTEEDFEHFAPPTLDSERVLNSILSDPKRGLFCLNWDELADTLEIWGVS